MRIVQAYPPLIDEIDAAFHVRGRPILFAWGDRIFNPMCAVIGPELMAHEAVHGERQLSRGDGVEGWWHHYLRDPQFRLEEEVPAHIAEFKTLCAMWAGRWVSTRNMRRLYATEVARKLAAPLYGNLISVADAKQLILAA